MRIERLGDLGSAPAVLRAIAAGAERCGLPPPAALIGEWFVSAAVIAPSLEAVAVDDVFAVPTGISDGPIGGGWFGYLSYPDAGVDGLGPRIPQAAGGWSDCVLRQDRDGHWWYESLSGASLSGWVVEALRNPLAPRHFNITWGDADRETHRRGVLECLEAIAAGEIYQACVCTQFAGRLDGAPVDVFVEAVERTSPARAAYLTGEWGARAAGGAAGAGRMASRVDDVGPGRGHCADGRLARRDVPTRVGDRHTEAAGPSAVARLGATSPRDILRNSRFGVTRRGL